MSKLTMYVYYYRTYEKAVSGGGEREKGGRGARLVRSSQATSHYLSSAGEGEVVSKEVARRRGARKDEWK